MPPSRGNAVRFIRSSPFQADYDDLVALDSGWSVARRFTSRILVEEAALQLEVVMTDAGPRLLGVMVAPRQGLDGVGEALDPAVLGHLDWLGLVDAAVTNCALEVTEGRGWDPLASDTSSHDEAAAAARRVRRRKPTGADLTNILTVYQAHGIHGLTDGKGTSVDGLGYSERHARRLLAEAKKEASA